MFHEWNGNKKKTPNKRIKLLEYLYPSKKDDELELMSVVMTDKEVKDIARSHGMDEGQIAYRMK